jgi:hypothetical protein
MALGYSSDRYWVDDYWFNAFLWWVLGSTTILSTVPRLKYVIRFENRTNVVTEETRKYVVPLEE